MNTPSHLHTRGGQGIRAVGTQHVSTPSRGKTRCDTTTTANKNKNRCFEFVCLYSSGVQQTLAVGGAGGRGRARGLDSGEEETSLFPQHGTQHHPQPEVRGAYARALPTCLFTSPQMTLHYVRSNEIA